MKKIKIILIALLVCLLSTVPCEAATKVINIKATVTYKIQKGEKIKLYVKGHKDNKNVKWKSSNTKIASVSKTGVVTGKKGGTCKITATISKKKYTTKVTVMDGEKIVYEEDISSDDSTNKDNTLDLTTINSENETLYVGQTFNLKIIGTKNKITWKSSNSKIASVSSSGKVTAKKEGTATITATYEDSKYVYTHECTIKVISEWVDQETLESLYGLFFINDENSIEIIGKGEGLTGSANSVIIDIPTNMIVDEVYGSDIRYKFNGSDILFNITDLKDLDIL